VPNTFDVPRGVELGVSPGADDYVRYIAHLQSQLVAPGTESYLLDERRLHAVRRDEIAARIHEAAGGDLEAHPTFKSMLAALEEFTPRDANDSFAMRQVFSRLIDALLNVAVRAQLPLHGEVVLVASPDIRVSPTALPSDGKHHLFAGTGTMLFCNYWSKVFVQLLAGMNDIPPSADWKVATREVLESSEIGELATALAIRYSVDQSLMHFGKVEMPPELDAARFQLLDAMEAFVVGHEMGHFMLEEDPVDGLQMDSGPESELECDLSSLILSVGYGLDTDNPYAWGHAGALFFLWSVGICERVRSLFTVSAPCSGTHPELSARVELIFDVLNQVDNQPLVIQTNRGFEVVAATLSDYVVQRIQDISSATS